jgi:phosphoserine phosphatase RsbU/P
VRRLETGGMIVGLFPHAVYDQETVQLTKGDLLTVFSDGVSEALSATGEEFGEDRIQAVLASTGSESTDALLQTLLGAIRQFTECAVQNDDVTAMIVKYLA